MLVDTYTFKTMVDNAGNTKEETITKENAYEAITDGNEVLDEASVPVEGRVITCTPTFYKFLKQNPDAVLDTEIGQNMRIKGVVASMDGANIQKIPTAMLPENVNFILSHKVATTQAIKLAEYLRDIGHQVEQVQDFYPTPATASTCMYYTGIDPFTMEEVYVPKDPHEKAMQRALMQYKLPQNYFLVEEALKKANRLDLIGYDKKCLIKPRSDNYDGKSTKPYYQKGGKGYEKLHQKYRKKK